MEQQLQAVSQVRRMKTYGRNKAVSQVRRITTCTKLTLKSKYPPPLKTCTKLTLKTCHTSEEEETCTKLTLKSKYPPPLKTCTKLTLNTCHTSTIKTCNKLISAAPLLRGSWWFRVTAKETHYCVKRDLLQCQKRPTTVSKETHYSVKRDLLQSWWFRVRARRHGTT